jgi:hypothetical protein
MLMAGKQAAPRKRHSRRRSTSVSSGHWQLPAYLSYAALALIVLFYALIRFRLRVIPLERDEGEYAYGGQLLLQGVSLYKHLYTMKLPGTHLAYAALLATIGYSPARIHLGLLLVNAATLVLIFLFSARVFGRLAGLVAAATYGLLSVSVSVEGFAAQATHFVALFALAGTWLLLEALKANKIWLVFCSGLLFGLAFLMKQPGLLFFFWAVLYLLWRKVQLAINWKRSAVQLAALVSGGALPLSVTLLLIWRSGAFQDFWFWTYVYVREYGSDVNLADGLMLLRTNGGKVIDSAVWIWTIAAVGLTAVLWNARARANAFVSISFLVSSFLAVCPGLYFRAHYFILVLPAVGLFAGIAVSSAKEALSRWTKSRAVSTIPVVMFLIALLSSVYQQRDFLLETDPATLSKRHYGHNPFPEALVIADYITKNTQKDSTVAVLGSEPEIYFYSHRRAATGYIYTYPLLEPGKYAVQMQREMAAEIQAARPEMVVLVNLPASWSASPTRAPADEILNWTNTYVQQNYKIDGVVEVNNPSEYYWGENAEKHKPSLTSSIIILKKKSS